MSYKFNEIFETVVLEINNSNRMLAKEAQKEAEHQKELEEMQHQASQDAETEELNFNDY
jgi:hypothetical protein|tara:strand:+ start:524 stop:700 length:177 start_codon:yes stop_codon:yes gene_type:complete